MVSQRPSTVIVNRIRSAVILGQLVDGDPLPPEPDLAAMLDTTPFAVREALATLRKEDLVVTRRGRSGGSFIKSTPQHPDRLLKSSFAQLSPSTVRDIGDWRTGVLTGMTTLAVEQASSRNLLRLNDYADRVVSGRDNNESRTAYLRFHQELAAATQTVRLAQSEIALQEEVGWVFAVPLTEARGCVRIGRSLLKLSSALQDRDVTVSTMLAREAGQVMANALVRARARLDEAGGGAA
jgi:DNA-binding FadR family transcriptional regulator